MKKILAISVICFALCSIFVVFGQDSSDILIIRGEVKKIQEPEVADGPEETYHVVNYSVLKVCKGRFSAKEIKVGHLVGTAKDLEAGDEVCRRIKPTNKFREIAKVAKESFDIDIPEELLADYVYVGVNQPCTCE